MNSFNHYSFGAVGSWMYNCSLGIQPDNRDPGFRHFFLKPVPDPTGGMTYARGYYDSMYGRIESSWEILSDGVRYSFVVPANTSATVCLPAENAARVKVDGQEHDCAVKDGYVRMELESGRYVLEVTCE